MLCTCALCNQQHSLSRVKRVGERDGEGETAGGALYRDAQCTPERRRPPGVRRQDETPVAPEHSRLPIIADSVTVGFSDFSNLN